MSSDIRIEDLAHVDVMVFERMLFALGIAFRVAPEQTETLLIQSLRRIDAEELIGPSEQGRRTSMVLGLPGVVDEHLHAIAIRASEFSPAVKNAVAYRVPADMKRLVLGRQRRDRVVEPASEEVIASDHPVQVAAERVRSGCQVLLVGTDQEHDHNRRLLRSHGLKPQKVSPSQIDAALMSDVVAIVVARSCWTSLPPEKHASFLEKLCQFSSFAWLKIDSRLFSCPAEFDVICKAARSRNRNHEVDQGASADITEAEITRLMRAARAIGDETSACLFPGDINDTLARVLIAGVNRHVEERHATSVQVKKITSTTLRGGKSNALLLQLEPDDGGCPLVAKVDSLDRLRDEMRRFSQFMLPRDSWLNPTLHFHIDKGAIVFGLIDSPDGPTQPAPTLEKKLTDLYFQELTASDGGDTESSFQILLTRCVEKLSAINCKRCDTRDYETLTWVDVNSLRLLQSRGVHWCLDNLSDGSDPFSQLVVAERAIQSANQAAIVHGDMHLRNVLVRDREPFFIDYACSGPGHPIFDLVRLESAILFRFLRMTAEENSIRTLLTELQRPDCHLTLSDLNEGFFDITSSTSNRIALFVVLACRLACKELLDDYGLPYSHYPAMKLIVAGQSLVIPELQSGIVRSAIWASAEVFATTNG